jgi:hypothetical protein
MSKKDTNTRYVRVLPKTGAQSFFRCGMAFTPAWSEVEVDDATAKRLDQEQMLEVVADKPDGLEPAVSADGADDAAKGAATAAASTGKKR